MPQQQTRRAYHEQNRLLDEDEAADFLGLSPRTLQGLRVKGGGPDYIKIGSRAVRYRLSDLEDFIEDRRQSNTSEDEDLDDSDEDDFDDE
ncbi:MAG: helix-turn-helix transcriptional regulator [Pseudomonadota bacterium]